MQLETIWYRDHALSRLLLPLSWVFRAIVAARRMAYLHTWLPRERVGVPVIVVGNLTVGGTGKTPLVLWLAEWLLARGYRPGIIARGYRGRAAAWPQWVRPDSDPVQVGDEAVLLARRSRCPVAAGPERARAAAMLVADRGCDMIVSDDGLQHYRLHRDLEILVLDGQRGLGNGRCLPAGPLREPASRRGSVDLIVCHGADWPGTHRMDLVGDRLVGVGDPARARTLADLQGHGVTAVAGVGNPERFFARLRAAGLRVDERPYPDHHAFSAEDAAQWPPGPVVMTEKDAVKCAAFAGADHWYLPVVARLDAAFATELKQRIEAVSEWIKDC
jgi:tetraacyldisaccharide 4'-kinase